jgi:hypothetical protein
VSEEGNDYVVYCTHCNFIQAHIPGVSLEFLGQCPNCGFLVTKESLKTIVTPEGYDSAYAELVKNRNRLVEKFNE